MHSLPLFLTISSTLIPLNNALPAPSPAPTAAPNVDVAELQERQLLGGVLSGVGSLLGVVGSALDDLNNLNGKSNAQSSASSILINQVTPTATVTDAAQAQSAISAVWQASPTPNNVYAGLGRLVAAGLTGEGVGAANSQLIGNEGMNSNNNNNPINPSPAAYPKAGPNDAPYDLSEADLRKAIYIPSTFQYGRKGAPQPVILVPGTGATGYLTFVGNYIPLLQDSTIGDPVWLNIPGYLLADAQVNSEYVAYAINYIYGVSNKRQVAVLGWSQGNIDIHWANKFWPSTRAKLTDHVAISPDYHGTVIANAVSLGEPLPPSFLQQEYNSNFITTLRNYNGDSAYVPTTNVYSGFFDEIVEPQQGTGASAFLNDVRKVGVSNSEVQVVCAGQPAGGFYTHEGVLANALGFALFKDALANPGPGQPSRLNLGQVCAAPFTPGLHVTDVLLTENAILVAGIATLAYPNKVVAEPPIEIKS
ncbi:hypothetical protein LTR78_007814 [Recurvomyces mirabilis]|uniref:Lipase B n=1 Tax=Recurvomyces mirabilis TaxID=574656 RepID=A0AAE0TTW1_9PEZI|nr:hypothetical protein LTR78_007814 [Recurvomyces mirabilis]KAK5160144.1 hypothetical protein LTS14_002251 [Recurvomyces mirabilis]